MSQVELAAHDLSHIAALGLNAQQVHAQLRRFREGFSYIDLHRPCTPGDGITVLAEHTHERLIHVYEDAMAAGRVMKFVPASGEGSRMFRYLLATRERLTHTDPEIAAGADELGAATRKFFERLSRYPFYDALRDMMGEQALNAALAAGRYADILDILLTGNGLNYPNLPKGLLPFHRYDAYCRTPFEEHLAEAASYTRDGNNIARIHFTVSPEHLDDIRRHLDAARARYESDGVALEITCSIQKSETDTIAVTPDNQPFRDREGRLVFRPGGHGALLENLNDLQADIVVIKNIDNVVPDYRKALISLYRRVSGGYLIEAQNRVFGYMNLLNTGTVDQRKEEEMLDFLRHTLCVIPPDGITRQSASERRSYMARILNRPLRVCSMVRNTGEPGGGPFWVRRQDGAVSLQIVEFAQIHMTSEAQYAIFRASTHFNPVDLVCGVRDYTGRPFDLRRFRDENAGFISSKSRDGQPLKAMELPGLWNGSMADWNTIFMETPAETFNPVKTIDDLLRPEHQPETTV